MHPLRHAPIRRVLRVVSGRFAVRLRRLSEALAVSGPIVLVAPKKEVRFFRVRHADLRVRAEVLVQARRPALHGPNEDKHGKCAVAHDDAGVQVQLSTLRLRLREGHRAELGVLLQKLLVASLPHFSPLLQHENIVGSLNRAQAMGND